MSYDFTEEEKELIERISKQAHDNQLKYRGCSQTTLLALQENLGIGDLSKQRPVLQRELQERGWAPVVQCWEG
jgi:hypothetical protein